MASPPAADNEGSARSLYVFCTAKAGMSSMVHTREHIDSVVASMSKDSAHLAHARKLDENTTKRVAALRAAVSADASRVAREATRVTALAAALAAARDDGRRVRVVVDMDMFFAAASLLGRPELRDKPVAIGGTSMISTANYEGGTACARPCLVSSPRSCART